ncbi:MAG TPA: YigZ family protein [Pseudogracilibacillus sp.]|nr:YigZ family protein [Pseudogracilibacillus sp.]
MSHYYTIKQSGTHEVIIQKSRFIGHIARADTEAEAQAFIQSIQKKHHNATHNCFAYVIGEQDQHQKANDDGEPSGTAGIPMLEVLKRLSLKNTVVVITRYFGGVKLGAGGLIRAYSSVTSETIKAIGVVQRERMQGYRVLIEYPLLGKVQNFLTESNYLIEHIEYLENVQLDVYVPIEQTEQFNSEIIDVTNGDVTLSTIEQKFVERDINLFSS